MLVGELAYCTDTNELWIGTATGNVLINVMPEQEAVQWADILGKPTSFNPSAHNHPWANITDPPAQATRWPSWAEVTSKPTTFTPSSHSHAWANITSGIPAYATRWPSWSEVTSKPSTFAPSSHTHPVSQITGSLVRWREAGTTVIAERTSQITQDVSESWHIATIKISEPGDYTISCALWKNYDATATLTMSVYIAGIEVANVQLKESSYQPKNYSKTWTDLPIGARIELYLSGGKRTMMKNLRIRGNSIAAPSTVVFHR